MKPSLSGFTLIELSIVLVIVGLLAGAVVGGQTLIKSAQLRSVRVEAQEYVAAIKQFQEKYQALPGDFPAATTTWSASINCGSRNYSNTNETCNGNGDGRIGVLGSSYNEGFHAWKHLANAGLAGEGNLGTSGATSISWLLPISKIKNGGFLPIYVGAVSGSGNLFNGEYGNVLFFGGRSADLAPPYSGATSPYPPLYPILGARDAKNVDTKFDDGLPATGSVRGYVKNASWNQTLCSTSTSASAGTSADYDVSQPSSGRQCGLLFLTGF